MDANQVDQMLIIYGSKLPAGSLPMLRDKLIGMDYNTANVMFAQMKDPTLAMVLSIILGAYGIDRIYVGDVGLGILKLLTCGGCGVWWLVDLFLIMDKTRQANLDMIYGIM